MERVGELLAFWTLLSIELSVLLHIRPPVSMAYCSVGYRPTSDVATADSFVDLEEEVFNFARVYTQELGVGEGFSVEFVFKR